MSPTSSKHTFLDFNELKELTEKLITCCHILDHEGVTDGYGHISARVRLRG